MFEIEGSLASSPAVNYDESRIAKGLSRKRELAVTF